MSLQQQWLWGILQKAQRWNFLSTLAWRLKGPLQVDVLSRCFSAVLGRHESLRARIVLIDNTPQQQAEAPQDYRLEPIHVGSTKDAHSYLSAFFSSYLDLTTGPLIETRLLRVAEEEHILAVAIHHVVTDAMSMAILFKELWTLYHCYISGRDPMLGPVQMQYFEYAALQRSQERQWIETHAPYWKARLQGADRPRLPAQTVADNCTNPRELDSRKLALGHALTGSLKSVARLARTSPAIAVFALYAYAVSRICGQKDMVISNNIAGRDRSDLMNVMGYFVHLVPLRIQLTGTESFLQMLSLVSQEFLTSYEHLDGRCVVAEFPELCHGTFFQWISAHPHQLSAQLRVDGGRGRRLLSAIPFPVIRELDIVNTMDFDAGGWFFENDRSIVGAVTFRKSLCSAQQMEQFCSTFRSLIERAVEAPHAALTSLC